MAEKKQTQAQKASASRAKAKQNTSKPKNSADKKGKNTPEVNTDRKLPLRAIAAVCYILLFFLFLVISMGQDGFMLVGIRNLMQGLFGVVAFYISIPCLLYLFVIQVTSGKNPCLMRSCCTIAFAFLCGCVSHLSLAPVGLESGFAFVKDLYVGGTLGTTGGVFCGLITELLIAAFGRIFSYIIMILGAIVCLLAAFNITIPSLIRAIQNRPRLDDDLEREEKPEPAAVVVNHIANKHIAHVEQRRRLEAERQELAALEAERLAEEERKRLESQNSRTSDMIRQISSEIDTDVPADDGEIEIVETADAPDLLFEQAPEIIPEVPVVPVPEPAAESIGQMPPLVLETAVEPVVPAEEPVKKMTARESEESLRQVAAEIEENSTAEEVVYCYPPIDLLKKAPKTTGSITDEMKTNTARLNETLASFKIDAHITNVTRGPSVTRYEVELEKGVRLSKLTSSADDIALSLGATGVRIAPIPGLISVVGIEVPNSVVTTVSLREVIDSAEFNRAQNKASFAVGKDIGGSCIIGNIAKFPHMLIAGTTGSGKSVCINSLIVSLLYKASPDEVKLIMVDPKMVELGIYNGIPHLLIPVVTDPKKAAGSLQWAVTEMMRRYRAMSDAGVRDLESYNFMVESGEIEGPKIPQLVVIVDELADLMMVAAKDVDESICRIAQMGRASGIHLIIATQRPSVDVITGTMKANIPSRIAFSVASAMESRIILDTQGAEKLVGRGDMLYSPQGCVKPMRVQGCFVSDSEVENVVNYVKGNFSTNYDQKIMEEIDKQANKAGKSAPVSAGSDPEPNDAEMAGDEMLVPAVDVIMETGQASVSMLQRRLKLGYARAARIVDEMEEKGIVGPFVGSKPRAILITKDQWAQMKSGQTLIISDDGAPKISDPVPEEID